ncbi:hypothetical protein P4N68_03225, partial [Corynebacterium felinum]
HTHKTPKTTGQRFKRISPVRKPQYKEHNTPLHSMEQQQPISDADLIKALMFGTGPLAENIGIPLALPPSVDRMVYDQEVEEIVAELTRIHSDSLQPALKQLRDSDPVVVSQGLEKVTTITTEFTHQAQADPQMYFPPICGIVILCLPFTYRTAPYRFRYRYPAVVALKYWGSKDNQAVQETLVTNIIDSVHARE